MGKVLNRRQFLNSCKQAAFLGAGCALMPTAFSFGATADFTPRKGFIRPELSPFYTPLGNQVIRCELCPHHCEVAPGERGLCDVRKNIDGKYYSLVYANPCAIHIDPVEKKPFFHVLPGTQSFSLATAGCNFECKFCQNWNISQAKPEETRNYNLSPETVVSFALENGCRSIASTYVEPTIFMEYMLDIGRLAKSKPILKVMHSNGFVAEKPLLALCEVLEAACIDLKGFTEEYYQSMTEGRLQPVLNTLKTLCQKKVHTEIVTLVIPGRNDDVKQIRAMCQWIKENLNAGVPLHFTRFYPKYKLKGIAPTPVSTLEKARDIAMEEGLEYVYLGNVFRHPGEHTYCPECKKMLIERIGYDVKMVGMNGGRCKYCEKKIPGIWGF
jgi:pyruvate formate lyase activating enzyme